MVAAPVSKGKSVGQVEGLTTSPFCRLDSEEEGPEVGIDGQGRSSERPAMVAGGARADSADVAGDGLVQGLGKVEGWPGRLGA